jgi:hypothetical protein
VPSAALAGLRIRRHAVGERLAHVMGMRFRMLASVVPLALIVTSIACHHKTTAPTPVCSITIDPASRAFDSNGGTATVAVTTSAASCTWTTTSDASWITIDAGASGTGSGTVEYRVAASTSSDSRSGTLKIGDQTHHVTQAGQPPATCHYTLTPSSASMGSNGGSGDFAVATADACAWSATSSASWLTVTAGSQGTGSGTVSYHADRQDAADTRNATITVAGESFTLTQDGRTAPADCTYAVSPVQFTPCMPAGHVSALITTQDGCPWTVSSNVPWLLIDNGSSGVGSQSIDMSFSSNYDAPREGIAMVRWPTPTAGQNVRVSQAGCHYSVSKSVIAFAAAGGVGGFDLLQESEPNSCGGALQDACVWSAVADVPWITITTTMPRSGDSAVAFTVAANSGAARSGTITIRDKTVRIDQAGP